MTKICTKCGIEKEIGEFCKDKNRKDGRCGFCKKCNKEYRQKNKNEIKERRNKYLEDNKEELKEKRKKYYILNKEKINEKHKKYREDNRKERPKKEKPVKCHKTNKERKKEYYQKNKDKEKERRRKYCNENKEKVREKNRKYSNNRTKIDINFKLTKNLRSRLRKIIKQNQKSGSAVRDLGCSVEFLRQYLESKFQENMTWDNWGNGFNKWNIDHIVPLSSFDLTNREELLKACHYTNLQPLWWIDNIRKSNKILNNT